MPPTEIGTDGLTFAGRLQRRLAERHLSQAELAATMTVGTATVNSWVRGHTLPGARTLLALADYLDVGMRELLLGPRVVTQRAKIPLTKYLTRAAAARELSAQGIPVGYQSLADMAHDGRGPKFARINGRCFYRRDWLEQWVAREMRENPGVRRRERGAQRSPTS